MFSLLKIKLVEYVAAGVRYITSIYKFKKQNNLKNVNNNFLEKQFIFYFGYQIYQYIL